MTEPTPGLRQTLTWKGGFWLALVIPMSGLTLVGYEIGALGAWGALAVWLGTSVIALLQNFIYSELAGIYPEASGGIAVYASRIWGRYFAPLGGILGWGYWAGSSLTLAVVSLVIGDLVQAQWFPADTGTISLLRQPRRVADLDRGRRRHRRLPDQRVRPQARHRHQRGHRRRARHPGRRVHHRPDRGRRPARKPAASPPAIGPLTIIVTLLTWGFVASWTSYGTEIAATFTPEYKNPKTDVARALRSSALLMVVVVGLSTTIFPAAVGESAIAANPVGFFATLVTKVLGSGFGGAAIAIVCAAQLIALGSATSDSGRALYGMAAERLTPRQLHKLNRAGQPVRGMTVDLLFNLAILFLVSNVAGIIFASNLGYLLSVVFALGGPWCCARPAPTPSARSDCPGSGSRSRCCCWCSTCS